MNNRQEFLCDTDVADALTFEGVEQKYTRVVMINRAVTYLAAMCLALLLFFIEDTPDINVMIIVAEAVLFIAAIINIFVAKKACAFKGYALREKDVTYRSGLFFHKIITIPFCKVQQVGITQGPVARIFGLYSVDIFNGSAWQSSISIPGLTKNRAEALKQHITNKLNDAAK